MLRQTLTLFLERDEGLIEFDQTHYYIQDSLTAPHNHPIKQRIQRELFEEAKPLKSPIHDIINKQIIQHQHLMETETIPLEKVPYQHFPTFPSAKKQQSTRSQPRFHRLVPPGWRQCRRSNFTTPGPH
ncbi:hypothetical protein O181_119725 [Austropuccinia psidii MF-1]|uniref:Uncharacterized protein n=1 Tax=Austropuccinia psidii MF-1 TaxID=1389203 RepID=A0A9Q3Q0M9_9BASI|nr:hypothetical protein [Austropuccinia psidii MF-1]